MIIHRHVYVDGSWVRPIGEGSLDILNPATEEPTGRVPAGDERDVDRAVVAASRAFDRWAATPLAERTSFVQRLAEGLQTRVDEIARTIALEVGTPIRLARSIQADLPVTIAGTYARILQEFRFEEEVGSSLVVREPVGVVGAITPWNYPLHQAVAKVAPALAAGCTVVLKPSEVAPLTAFLLAAIADEIGLPNGVLNVVSGTGPVAGEAVARHPLVDMVSFTGSVAAGRRVSELAAATVKRVALELGGKSASVVLDDADLPSAVSKTVGNCFLNSGQTCNAWTRLLVPRSRHDEAAELARSATAKFTMGDPLEGQAKLGPLVSSRQRERVRGYIRLGVEEGATLVVGGYEAPDGLPIGYYVKPTVFADVRPDMTIAREEIFGPVLSIIPYDGDEEAIRIANGTVYGLAGAVWSGDRERARRVARRLRSGQVDLNGARFNPLAPFGGYRQSGNGRELGRFGLEEFLEVKAIQS
jgi:betaine-aldehyde dehydrogenase